MKPRETIEAFDRFLADRRLIFDAVVVGGTALGLLGIVSRQTKDCDVLCPALPAEIRSAAQAFAQAQHKAGNVLGDDWLNNGPSSLTDVLLAGWRDRLQVIFTGNALTLHSLGRMDLLMSKLFALCDRGLDLQDCVALAPTPTELEEVMPWLGRQDGNPDWPAHVREVVDDLKRRLRDGI